MPFGGLAARHKWLFADKREIAWICQFLFIVFFPFADKDTWIRSGRPGGGSSGQDICFWCQQYWLID